MGRNNEPLTFLFRLPAERYFCKHLEADPHLPRQQLFRSFFLPPSRSRAPLRLPTSATSWALQRRFLVLCYERDGFFLTILVCAAGINGSAVHINLGNIAALWSLGLVVSIKPLGPFSFAPSPLYLGYILLCCFPS
ncbi:hypothetical protein C8R47DRAFT_1148053, partial [Mycena vitilis]